MGKFQTLLSTYPGAYPALKVVVKQFVENVIARTGNQISFSIVADSTLGNVPTVLQMLVEGKVDMSLHPVDRLDPLVPKLGCVVSPFVFDDAEHAYRVLDGEFPGWVESDLSAVGLTCLGYWEWGFRQLANSRRPIRTPSDMQGLKIRVPAVPPYFDIIRAFGGVPVMIDHSKIERITRQGLIDGLENPVLLIYPEDVHIELLRKLKFFSLISYSYSSLGHFFNKRSFESLTPEQQLILREESRRVGVLERQIVREHEAEQIAFLSSEGVQIDHPAPEPFRALLGPVFERLDAYFGANNMREFLALVEQQRKVSEGAPV